MEYAGCAVNGPKAAAKNQQVAVAWFTGASGAGKVRVAFSSNAGKTYIKSKSIDNISPNGPVGRVDVVLLNNHEAIVSWLGRSTENQNNVLFLRKVGFDGSQGPYIKVAEITENRRVGFPQLERVGNWLYIAWTEPNADKAAILEHNKVKGLKMVKLEINDIPPIRALTQKKSPPLKQTPRRLSENRGRSGGKWF